MDTNENCNDFSSFDNAECFAKRTSNFTTSSNSHVRVAKSDPRSVHHFYKVFHKSGSAVKVWECSICGREFQHKYLLRRHLPGHTDERNFHCQVCGKSFRQLSTLSQHRTIHSHARPHTCMVCNKRFNRISTLISHRKTHCNDKPFKCHICDKGFHQKGNLRNHLYSHTNERPYRCTQCDKGFNQQSNLTCHIKKVHSGTGISIPYLEMKSTGEIKSSNGKDDKTNLLTKNIQIGEISPDAPIPFALLKLDQEQAALVKIYPANTPQGGHILSPVSAQDLITGGKLVSEMNPHAILSENNNSTLRLYIPIVAIIESTMKPDGELSIAVHSPSTYNLNSSDKSICIPKLCLKSDGSESTGITENSYKIMHPDRVIITTEARNYFPETITKIPVNDIQQSDGNSLVSTALQFSSAQYLLNPQEPPSYDTDFDCRHMKLFESLETIETGKIKNELLTQLQDISGNEQHSSK